MAIDIFSPEWIAVRDALQADITSSGDALEKPGLDPGKSEFLRGRIALAREMIALPARKSSDQDD